MAMRCALAALLLPMCAGGGSRSPHPRHGNHRAPLLKSRGLTGCTRFKPCPMCTGDCDSDMDCAKGLMCYQRSAFQPISGCRQGKRGNQHGNVRAFDYCVRPATGANKQFATHRNSGCIHSKMKPQAYSQLLQATAMCDRTPGCSGVFDPGCDKKGVFFLCARGRPFDSSMGSCVYQGALTARRNDEAKVRRGNHGVAHRRKPRSGKWRQVPRQHCAFHRNKTTYRSVWSAELACMGDPACQAVYDPSCDGKGTVYTCRAGFARAASVSSCVYVFEPTVKPGYGTCTAPGFLRACANDLTLNSGNPAVTCAGTCAVYLAHSNCALNPPAGTDASTEKVLMKFVSMCRHLRKTEKAGDVIMGGRQ